MIDLKFIHKSACLWFYKKWRTRCKYRNNYYSSLWTTFGVVCFCSFKFFIDSLRRTFASIHNFREILSFYRHFSAYVSNKHWKHYKGLVWSGLGFATLSSQYVWLFANHVHVGHFFLHISLSRFYLFLYKTTCFLSTMSSFICRSTQNTIYNFNVIFAVSSLHSRLTIVFVVIFYFLRLALHFFSAVPVSNGTPPSNFELML